jgi:hypothetical protein
MDTPCSIVKNVCCPKPKNTYFRGQSWGQNGSQFQLYGFTVLIPLCYGVLDFKWILLQSLLFLKRYADSIYS